MTKREGTTPIDHLRQVCENGRTQTAGRAFSGVRHDDTDADAGTFASDDAIDFNPFPMLALMQTTGADYAVFGQIAGILHGSSEPTGDLDLLWDGSRDAVDAIASAFEGARVVIRDEHFEPVDVTNYRHALSGAKVYFEGLHSAGDLCTPRLRWGSLDVRAFLRRKVWAHADGLSVPYISLEDLLTMRKAVPGAKHERRTLELENLSARR